MTPYQVSRVEGGKENKRKTDIVHPRRCLYCLRLTVLSVLRGSDEAKLASGQRVPKLANMSDACSSTDRLGWNVRLGIFLPIPPVILDLRFRFRSWGVFGSSINRRMCVWSELSMGATDMSLTARKRPQLFRCSFSSRKKFQTNLLRKHNGTTLINQRYSLPNAPDTVA